MPLTRETHMDLATALTTAALRRLSVETVIASITGTALALTDICDNIKTRPISILRTKESVSSKPLDGWSFPDAIWLTICRRQPRLNTYPLGEIAERAIKKTLLNLMLPKAPRKESDACLDLGERELQQHLRQTLKPLGHNGLLRLFLAQYFFETSIDYLRRPSGNSKSDYSHGYHFSKKKRMISLKSEKRFRQRLNKECEALAKKFFPSSAKGKLKPSTIEKAIESGLKREFRLQLPESQRPSKRSKPVVNVIAGLAPQPGLEKSYNVAKKTKRILIFGKHTNVRCSLDRDLETWLGHSLHPLVKDLIDIGITVHMSDVHTKRNPDLGRRLGIVMPVRSPSVWTAAREHLERAVANLGRDDFQVYFTRRSDDGHGNHRISVTKDNRCVCLFSGGIDSVAGAAWILDNKMSPVLVSHHATSILASNIQKPIAGQLEKIYHRQLTSFRITKLTLQKLKRARIPEAVLGKLQLLQGRAFLKPKEFSFALKKKIGDKHVARYESLILNHARELPHISFFLGRRVGYNGRYKLGGTAGELWLSTCAPFCSYP
jgi:hypothetical protein